MGDWLLALILVGHILIPAARIDQPVYRGRVENQALVVEAAAISWAEFSTPLCGDGNAVIYGHRETVFREIAALRQGDVIYANDCRYEVSQVVIVRERGVSDGARRANTSWMEPTSDARLTLITCEGEDSRRIVVARRL